MTDAVWDRATPRSVFDWFFRDRRSGRIAVAHVPNLPIVLRLGI